MCSVFSNTEFVYFTFVTETASAASPTLFSTAPLKISAWSLSKAVMFQPFKIHLQ